MRRIFLFLVIFSTLQVFAQGNGNSQAQCSISGTVTDSSSGEPIKGAEIIARTFAPRMGLPLRPASSSSDAKGEFVIERLDCGRYALRAFRDGYISRGQATILTLSPGQRVENVAVTLTPGGVISGHVVDETGKAVSGASIELMKFSFISGKRDLNIVSSASTNKGGEYRIEGIAPGQYFLRANITPHGVAKASHDDKAYVPLYFPNANDLTRATTLEVKPAQELAGMDFEFTPIHSARIAGQVVDSSGSLAKAGAEVTLLADDGYTNFPGGQTTSDKAGHFEFFNVPPGLYVVVAQSANEDARGKNFWGQLPVSVEETNVSDLKLRVSTGQEVTGRLHVDSGVNPALGKLTASLESQQPSAITNLLPELESTSVSADGSFRFEDVPEGNYTLNFFPLPPGTYLKSSGSGDAADTVVTVGSGHVPPLDYTLSMASARIDGTVSNASEAGAGITVVLVPEGKRRGQFSSYRVSLTDKSSQFSLRAIPPGDYKLFAWEGIERREFMNPDFLRQYEDQGRAIHVDQQSSETVQLEAIRVGGDTP